MTIRSISVNSVTRVPAHSSTVNGIPAGQEGAFIWDDALITSRNKLRAVLQDIMQAASGSAYFPEK